MSGRSAARGSEAARSIRLALRTSSIVAVSSAKPSRRALCCRGRRPLMSSPIAAATVAIPPPRRTTSIHADEAGRYHRPRFAAQDLMGGEVALISKVDLGRHDRAGVEVDRVLGLVGETGAAVLQLG